ncbi:MAG: hypothetical protein E6G80_19680 [Alphaproteobacteria bacterium]|nr:MAG: hypothetical protein E6G80_19680 [Alphaproteobacteria bacterium]
MFAKLAFDPDRDFAPVTLAVASLNVIIVNPSLLARDLKELVALIKANPGKYSYATGGVGTQSHLLGEMLRLSLGLDIVHVPFNGAAPAVASAVAGHTPIALATVASAAQALEAKQLRALAVASKKRSQLLFDVPTTAEAGYPQIEGDSWVGLLAPAGTPREIIGAVRDEIASILESPDVKERLPSLGRFRGRRQHARGLRPPHQGRDRDLGQGRPRSKYQGGVSRARACDRAVVATHLALLIPATRPCAMRRHSLHSPAAGQKCRSAL